MKCSSKSNLYLLVELRASKQAELDVSGGPHLEGVVGVLYGFHELAKILSSLVIQLFYRLSRSIYELTLKELAAYSWAAQR